MTYLRFSRQEYRALSQLCRPLDLRRWGPVTLKSVLVASLADTMPKLGARLAGLSRSELRLLYQHFRGRRPGAARCAGPDFSATELRVLTEACAPFPFLGRFVRHLRRCLARYFQDRLPGLAAKLARLDDRQFQALYEQARDHRRGTSPGS